MGWSSSGVQRESAATPLESSGRVVRRYVIEEEVIQGAVVPVAYSTPHPTEGQGTAYAFGWYSAAWLLRHQFLAGVMVTLVIATAIVGYLSLTTGITLGPACPALAPAAKAAGAPAGGSALTRPATLPGQRR